MRKVLSSILLIVLLAGCGYTPTAFESSEPVETQQFKADSLAFAQGFSQRLSGINASINVHGASVSVQHEGRSPLTYDFAEAQETGLVRIRYEDYQGSVPLSNLSGSSSLVVLSHAGIQLALGAAKGGGIYPLTHPDFVKDELYQSMAAGAVFSLRPYTNALSLSQTNDLERAAALIVKDSKSLSFTDLGDSGLAHLDILIDLVSGFGVFPRS